VYERQCEYVNKPQCIPKMRQKCENVPIKGCRDTYETKTITIPVQQCKVTTEQRCFDFDKKQCKNEQQKHVETITWNDEVLTQGEESKQLCMKVKQCNVVDRTIQKTKKVPERKCEQVPNNRRNCQTIQVPQPPIQVPYTDYRTEYKQQCYNVPKPVCKQVPCSYAVQTQNVCPTCIMPGVPGPACGNNPSTSSCGGGRAPQPQPEMCGACRQQNVQMCTKMKQECEMTYEKVCQSVPIRVPFQNTRTVQPPPRPEVKCETETTYSEQCRTVYTTQTIEVPVQSCNTQLVEKCEPINIPSSSVQVNPRSEDKEFLLNICQIETLPSQHCVPLPVGEVCSNKAITKTVRVRSRKCDRTSYKPKCATFQEEICQNNAGQVCKNVPREVCQPECPQTNYCNTCQQFAGQGGFDQCGTPTCPNYIASLNTF